MLIEFLDGRVIVKVGDLTGEDTDAIVNAANRTLFGGGGVDGAIHKQGGPAILEECRRLRETHHPNGLAAGEAVITTGGLLKARYVIHTVGPVYGQNRGRDRELLANSYRASISLAEKYGLASIAFPAISTGAYGYPRHEAAEVVSETLSTTFLAQRPLKMVKLVFHNDSDASMFLRHARF